MQGLIWQRKLQLAAWVLRNEGIKSFSFKALSATKLYRRLLLIHRFLDQPEGQATPRTQVTVDLLRKNEIGEYPLFRSESDSSDIRDRLEAGQLCFIVKHKSDIVHASWAVTGRAWIEYLSTQIWLPPDEVYIYESFTSPAFRGQNISPTRSLEMARYFRNAGFRRIIAAMIPEDNRAFRAAKKTGYRPFGVIGYLKIGPWRYDFCRTDNNGKYIDYKSATTSRAGGMRKAPRSAGGR